MKTVLVLCLLLVGCSSLPTLQYCEKVKYERVGAAAHIEAECTLPVGAGML